MEQKIYKPKSCVTCPCFKSNKNQIWCGSEPKLKVNKELRENIKERMWDRCPIAWDK